MSRNAVLILLPLCLSAASCGRNEKSGPPPPPGPSVAAAAEPVRTDPVAELAKSCAVVRTQAELDAVAVKPKNVATQAREPYIGAIAFDADTGRILLEDNADGIALPASTLKLMLLLVIQEKIESGAVTLAESVPVSVRAYKTGGSQVWLDPKETFPVEDLLYALMIQSANDAAVALAEHVAGSCEAMVAAMNKRAKELGMVNTRFTSVNGLPPAAGGKFDVTTPRDMAVLCAELCRHPGIFAYTGTAFRIFRPNSAPGKGRLEMRTHNPLLQQKTAGCDGLKTGWTRYAGFSIAATVKRAGRRVVVVMMGSPTKEVRNANLNRLIEAAFAAEAEQP